MDRLQPFCENCGLQTTEERLLRHIRTAECVLPGGGTKLPCGCKLWLPQEEGGEFKIIPCSLRCEIYQHVLVESERQGKPIEYRTL